MWLKLLAMFSVCFSFTYQVLASSGDIVLQNGLNGYDKCKDTHISKKQPSTNFNTNEKFVTGL